MNRKFCFKHSFTLVELIVSLAVFSILLTVMLQFFSGAQRLWTNTESRNQLYSDARVAMDLMSTLLQNAYYAQEAAPFAIDQAEPLTSNDKENRNSSMYFGTKAKMDLGGTAAIRFVSFQRAENQNLANSAIENTAARNSALVLTVLYNDSKNVTTRKKYNDSFPPFSTGYTLDDVLDNVVGFLYDEAQNTGSKYRYQLLDNVTGLQITPYRITDSGSPGFELIPSSKLTTKKLGSANLKEAYFDYPYLVEIQLSLMDPKNFEIWKDMDATSDVAKKFRREHEYTFTRAVFLDDRHELR